MDSSVGALSANTVNAGALSSDAVQEVWNHLIDGGLDAEEILCYVAAILVNKSDFDDVAQDSAVFRDQADTIDRVSVEYGGAQGIDRTSVALAACGN
jgi:hypothetical protein